MRNREPPSHPGSTKLTLSLHGPCRTSNDARGGPRWAAVALAPVHVWRVSLTHLATTGTLADAVLNVYCDSNRFFCTTAVGMLPCPDSPTTWCRADDPERRSEVLGRRGGGRADRRRRPGQDRERSTTVLIATASLHEELVRKLARVNGIDTRTTEGRGPLRRHRCGVLGSMAAGTLDP